MAYLFKQCLGPLVDSVFQLFIITYLSASKTRTMARDLSKL